MTTQPSPDDRVKELLTDAEVAIESILESEAVDVDPEADGSNVTEHIADELDSSSSPTELLESTALPELATQSATYLEDRDLSTVLEETGFESVSSDSSVPAAIANGSPVAVTTLRALQELAALEEDTEAEGSGTDRTDESALSERLTNLTALLERRIQLLEGESEGDPSSTADTETETEQTAPESSDNDELSDETDARSDSEEAERDDGDTSPLEALVDGFSDDVDALSNAVEAIGSGADEVIETAADDADETTEGDTSDDMTADDADETTESDTSHETDEAFFGDGDGTLLGGNDNEAKGTMFSTVPSRPTDRGDMGGVARLSTVPKRN